MNKTSLNIKIIGVIHSPYKSIKEAPRKCKKDISEIEIYKEYEQGLKDIDGFSHIHVFYWLHKSKDFSLLKVGIFYPAGELILPHLHRYGPFAVEDHSFVDRCLASAASSTRE